MESFEFLFWLAIFLFVVLRQAMGKKPPPEGSERTGGSERMGRPERMGGPERAEGATKAGTAGDPLGGMRERLLEAAREWEAEQRRRAGLSETRGQADAGSTATLERPASERGRRGASRPARPPVREGRSRGSQPPSERRPGGLRAEPERPGRPGGGRRVDAPQRRPRPRTEWRDVSLPTPRPPAEIVEPTPQARPARAEPRELATPAPRAARRPAPLESLERYDPLKRAIVLAEILGRPRALDEREGPPLG